MHPFGPHVHRLIQLLHMLERRHAQRHKLRLFANKYMDGMAHLGEVFELSTKGALLRKINQPDVVRACFALELVDFEIHDKPLWICATPVWNSHNFEAIEFIQMDPTDEKRLLGLIQSTQSRLLT